MPNFRHPFAFDLGLATLSRMRLGEWLMTASSRPSVHHIIVHRLPFNKYVLLTFANMVGVLTRQKIVNLIH